MTSNRLHLLGAVLLTAILLLAVSRVPAAAADRLSLYTYRDTRNLVALVEDAARLMERNGEQAFAEFGQKDSKWLNEDYYVFVYALDGNCLFNPISPELIGHNVIDLKDMNGKPIVQLITDVGRKPGNDASGWVFYLWQNHTQLIPNWKSAYVRKAIGPNGKTYVVGSGSYNIKVEKIFVEERVTMAAELLASVGKDEAFKRLKDPGSPFSFLDSFIFVLNEQGKTLLDPAFPTMAGRDLSEFRDAVGFPVIKEALSKLARADQAWVQYLWPKPGSPATSRKLLHVRKIVVDGETLVVGSDFFLATPIWMKVESEGTWSRNPPG